MASIRSSFFFSTEVAVVGKNNFRFFPGEVRNLSGLSNIIVMVGDAEVVTIGPAHAKAVAFNEIARHKGLFRNLAEGTLGLDVRQLVGERSVGERIVEHACGNHKQVTPLCITQDARMLAFMRSTLQPQGERRFHSVELAQCI